MGFIEKNLTSTEKIVRLAKLHWWVYVKSLFLLGLGLTIYAVSQQAGSFIVGVAAVSLIATFLTRSSSEFAITNRRVVFKTGLFSTKMVELQLNKAEGLQVEQGVIGRIFNFGKVRVASGGVVETFSPIANPFGFKKEVNEAVESSFNPAQVNTI